MTQHITGVRRRLLAAVITVSAVAATAATGRAATPTLTGRDGGVRISLPAGWESTPDANPDPAIQISATHEATDSGLTVVSESRVDMTLPIDGYADLAAQQLRGRLANPTQTPWAKLKIGAHDARRCEVRGTIGTSDLAYLMTVVELGTTYDTVAAWTAAKSFDKQKAGFESLAAGLTEVPGGAAAAEEKRHPVGQGTPVAVNGQTVRMMVLPDYAKVDAATAGADTDLIVADTRRSAFVMVTAGPRAPLADAAQKVGQLMAHSPAYKDPTPIAWVPLKAGGHDALRAEFRCTAANYHLAWQVTLVSTAGHLYQITAYCPASRFAGLKPGFDSMAASVNELAVGK